MFLSHREISVWLDGEIVSLGVGVGGGVGGIPSVEELYVLLIAYDDSV